LHAQTDSSRGDETIRVQEPGQLPAPVHVDQARAVLNSASILLQARSAWASL
jgi:hypothetical protein